MALTKTDILEKIRNFLDRVPKELRFRKCHAYNTYRHYGLSKQKCQDCFESLIEIMKSTLEKGEDILISNFGKFKVNEKKPRLGRNPSTNDSMILRRRRTVTFQCSDKLRKRINDNRE